MHNQNILRQHTWCFSGDKAQVVPICSLPQPKILNQDSNQSNPTPPHPSYPTPPRSAGPHVRPYPPYCLSPRAGTLSQPAMSPTLGMVADTATQRRRDMGCCGTGCTGGPQAFMRRFCKKRVGKANRRCHARWGTFCHSRPAAAMKVATPTLHCSQAIAFPDPHRAAAGIMH